MIFLNLSLDKGPDVWLKTSQY